VDNDDLTRGKKMTKDNDQLSIVRQVVVVVDIRSSTSILEDLKQTDYLAIWPNLLIILKEFLLEQHFRIGVEVYKFVGDGWILLFPDDISKASMMEFLTDLSKEFDMAYDSVRKVLQRRPPTVGLTFGVDSGELVKLEMNEQSEYIGRAINVAARLQDHAKKIEPVADYQAVFSKHSFNSMASPYGDLFQVTKTKASLRNIAGGEVDCIAYSPL
jgi:class 3 adenylate cyclase